MKKVIDFLRGDEESHCLQVEAYTMVCSAGMDENFVRERMGIDKLPAKVCCAPARSEPPPSYPSPYRPP